MVGGYFLQAILVECQRRCLKGTDDLMSKALECLNSFVYTCVNIKFKGDYFEITGRSLPTELYQDDQSQTVTSPIIRLIHQRRTCYAETTAPESENVKPLNKTK